jgi:hypothetical protein
VQNVIENGIDEFDGGFDGLIDEYDEQKQQKYFTEETWTVVPRIYDISKVLNPYSDSMGIEHLQPSKKKKK